MIWGSDSAATRRLNVRTTPFSGSDGMRQLSVWCAIVVVLGSQGAQGARGARGAHGALGALGSSRGRTPVGSLLGSDPVGVPRAQGVQGARGARGAQGAQGASQNARQAGQA